MFAYIEGQPVATGPDYVVLAVEGMGFRIFVPQSHIEAIAVQPQIKLHTHLAVRDDGMSLFGLQSLEELEAFRLLLTVSGVGPRLALAVLSTWSVQHLQRILAQEDYKSLTSVTGIGRKTAQRLVLELKDKISLPQIMQPLANQMLVDAEAALAGLGYRPGEVRPVLRGLTEQSKSVEELVRLALAKLAGGDRN